MSDPIIFRQSDLKAFMRCRRNWYWSYVRNLGLMFDRDKPREPATRDIGTMVHSGVESYYQGEDTHEGVRATHYLLTKGVDTEKWSKAKVLANAMVDGYVVWLSETGEDVGEETIEIETRFEASFGQIKGTEVRVTGQIDRVAKLPTGDLAIEDWKTVGKFDRPKLHEFQLRTYGVLYKLATGNTPTVARTSQLRRVAQSARSKPPYFDRRPKLLTEHELTTHYYHMHALLTEMVDLLHVGRNDARLYPFPQDFCSWGCDYLSLCDTQDDGDSDPESVVMLHFRDKAS